MSIASELAKMHSHSGVDKGSYGEKAVLALCEKYYRALGGILIHSYEYKVDPEQAGNIKKHDDGQLYIENLGSTTEIDVLFVTPYRVFPIEVKAYKAKKIILTDDGISGCRVTNKSPVHQNEMHCRHLYPYVSRFLPKGDTRYICPIVCFVDECTVEDRRSEWQREYIKVATLSTLDSLIRKLNTPLQFEIDIPLADSILKEAMTSYETYTMKEI